MQSTIARNEAETTRRSTRAGAFAGDRTVRWALVVGSLLIAAGVSCGEDAGNVTSSVSAGVTSPGLAGVWVTAPGFDDVAMTLKEDGTFTWDNRSLGASTAGTWTADATTLTFAFVEDQPFCAGETLTWEYQLEGDRLTSEVVATTCPGPLVPGNWEFERQRGT